MRRKDAALTLSQRRDVVPVRLDHLGHRIAQKFVVLERLDLRYGTQRLERRRVQLVDALQRRIRRWEVRQREMVRHPSR